MNMKIYTTGMIFHCLDKCHNPMDVQYMPSRNFDFANNKRSHPYLILSTGGNARTGFIQAMTITSMVGKDVTTEIPIKLVNGKVSYVIPYNIFSFNEEDLRPANYGGIIQDMPYITKDDFLRLLIDMYQDSMGFFQDSDGLKTRYLEYYEAFWKYNKDAEEYRNRKVFVPIKTPYVGVAGNIIGEGDMTQKPTQVGLTTSLGSIIQSLNLGEIEESKERLEEKEVTPEAPAKIPEVEVVDEKKNFILTPNVKPVDLKKLNKNSKFLRYWTNEDLIMLIRCYRMYGFDECAKYFTRVNGHPNSFTSIISRSIKELESRGTELTFCSRVYTPLTQWNEEDLIKTGKILENHKNDLPFLQEYLLMRNEGQINKFVKRVMDELKTREIVKE